MNKYTIYWPQNNKEVIWGRDLDDALYRQGYSKCAKHSIILWREGNDNNYVWSFETNTWVKKTIY